MCGFAVFLTSDGALAPRFRSREPWMGLIRHRGPDGEASYTEGPAALHFARLSILDLSQDAMQPMHSACGRYVMVFNGEIVNSRLLAQEHGLRLKGHSDTEVLLELYAKIGERAVSLLHGMYSFVVLDKQRGELAAFRDPFGIKPLYYAQKQNLLMLSSEIKPLLRALDGSEIEEDQVFRFLRRGETDDTEQTFFRGVRQVLPGHKLICKNGQIRICRSLEVDWTPQPVQGEMEEQESYRQALLRTIGEYLYADVPLGVSLSGGFDSSLLAYLIHANGFSAERLRMFTRAYQGYDANELEAARQVAERFGFDWQPVFLAPHEVPALLRRCSEEQEQPITSISILAFHQLYQRAQATGLKVLLEGHGGDELWAGYAVYGRKGDARLSHDGSSLALNDLLTKRNNASPPVEDWKQGAGETLSKVSPLAQRQLADLFGAKLQRTLRFVDRASMTNHLEVRVPYLDLRLALPALRLPDSWKIRNGQFRSFTRRMASPWLGEEVAHRPKVLIQDPQRKWLQKELREYTRDLLSSSSLWMDRFIDRPALKKRYEEFLKEPGRFDNLTFLMYPIFLEEWHQAMRPHLQAPRTASLTPAS